MTSLPSAASLGGESQNYHQPSNRRSDEPTNAQTHIVLPYQTTFYFSSFATCSYMSIRNSFRGLAFVLSRPGLRSTTTHDLTRRDFDLLLAASLLPRLRKTRTARALNGPEVSRSNRATVEARARLNKPNNLITAHRARRAGRSF